MPAVIAPLPSLLTPLPRQRHATVRHSFTLMHIPKKQTLYNRLQIPAGGNLPHPNTNTIKPAFNKQSTA